MSMAGKFFSTKLSMMGHEMGMKNMMVFTPVSTDFCRITQSCFLRMSTMLSFVVARTSNPIVLDMALISPTFCCFSMMHTRSSKSSSSPLVSSSLLPPCFFFFFFLSFPLAANAVSKSTSDVEPDSDSSFL